MIELNKIYCGDCMELMKQIPDKSVDMVLTDPPYTSPTVNSFGRKIIKRLSDFSIQEYYFTNIKKEFERILKPNAPVLIFCDDIYSAVLTALFYEWQQTNLIVWDKCKIGMGNPFRRQHELIFYANRGSIELNKEKITHIPSIIKKQIKKKFHGAEKPVEVLEILINGLTHSNDIICDPFAGSCTTAVAAVRTDRQYICIEIDHRCCDDGEKRIFYERQQLKMDF